MRHLIVVLVVFSFLLTLSNSQEYWQPVNAGLTNLNIRCILVDGSNLYAGTFGGGVFISSNSGAAWKTMNTGLTNTRIVAFAKKGDNIFAGSATAGIFITNNITKKWTLVNDGLTNLKISGIAVNQNRILVSTLGGGIFYSDNNGTTWAATNRGLSNWNVTCIYTNGTNLFAGTSDAGVFISTNSGSDWAEVNNGLSGKNITCLSGNGTIILAGIQKEGIYMSSNNGAIWYSLNGTLQSLSLFSLTYWNNDIFIGTDGGGVHFTTNSGVNWKESNTGLLNMMINTIVPYGLDILCGSEGGGVCIHKGFREPTVTTQTISAITTATAEVNGNITDNGGSDAFKRGVYWKAGSIPTISDSSKSDSGSYGAGAFTIKLDKLIPNTKYYAKAFAENIAGRAFGTDKSFATLPLTPVCVAPADVTFTSFTAKWEAPKVTGTETFTYTLEVHTNSTHTAHIKGSPFTALNDLSKNIADLTQGTNYYLRVKIVGGGGSSSWCEQTVSTKTDSKVPVLTTSAASSVTTNSAGLSGELIDAGGDAVTKRGFCWNTSGNPTISDNKKDESGNFQNGVFSLSINALNHNTKYFAKAFADNSKGTGYGNEINFVTLPNPPVCNSTSGITHNSITLNWSAPYPTGSEALSYNIEVFSDDAYTKHISGSPFKGESGLNKKISSLNQNTDYYYRICALNQTGASAWCIGSAKTTIPDAVKEEKQIKSASKSFSISNVYPNPANNQIEFNLEVSSSDAYCINVSDASGRTVINYCVDMPFNSGTHTLNINVSSLTPGSYNLNVTSPESKSSRKFIISR